MHTSIPTNQERHACVPTSNCKDMHFFAMYISLLFCNVVYKECSGEGYHTRVPHCGPVLVPARGGFYTALIRKGLRVVSLNMNYCNNQNW